MNTIIIAVISLSVIGLLCSTLITVASKLMFVKVDVRVEKLRNCLPGANCGACGYSSCDAYAEALAKEEAASNLCLPAGDAGYENINKILGISAGEGLAQLTAIVQCLGDSDTTKTKMDYVGIDTCFAVKHLYNGKRSCTFGCIGYGDCVSVCPNDAICIEKGLARIDRRKCSGCGVCVKVCPPGVIAIEKEPVHVAVRCKNTEKGAVVRSKCSRGCIGCKKCEKICPAKTITVDESLAVIDHTICYGCRECVDVCITKCIL